MTHCQKCGIVYENRVCPLCVLREHNNEVHDFIESKGRPLVRELFAYLQKRETPEEMGSASLQLTTEQSAPCSHSGTWVRGASVLRCAKCGVEYYD